MAGEADFVSGFKSNSQLRREMFDRPGPAHVISPCFQSTLSHQLSRDTTFEQLHQ